MTFRVKSRSGLDVLAGGFLTRVEAVPPPADANPIDLRPLD
jgi:hypothetical protein